MSAMLNCFSPAVFRRSARRVARHEALQDALRDLLNDDEDKIDVMQIMRYLQSELIKVQEQHTKIEQIHKNLQLISDIIDALHPVMDMDVEDDRFMERATKLEHVKIDVARVRAKV